MLKKQITCIICPIGCTITVQGDASTVLAVEGNSCKRGEAYATQEFIHPERILTSTIKVNGAHTPVVPVRSSKPIPKDMQLQCMDILRKTVVASPVNIKDVLIANILDTGVDIIATGLVE